MEVGDLITFYRKQAGLTIDELVEKSGVAKGTLNKIIGGVTKAPTLDNMKAIARALGKTLADFDDFPVETKKSSDAEESASEDAATREELVRVLIRLGFIGEDQQLSDRDLAFLGAVFTLLDTWFRENR